MSSSSTPHHPAEEGKRPRSSRHRRSSASSILFVAAGIALVAIAGWMVSRDPAVSGAVLEAQGEVVEPVNFNAAGQTVIAGFQLLVGERKLRRENRIAGLGNNSPVPLGQEKTA